ncbi:lipase/acyltransferase domain-containing protein [Streptomyces sp. enrichment culture]|uniref:lipase/acyltransferase domain-containing protein n=1 Tax=Streptomyces sp. enrichment culture TaxID=1795815 RepID=UPI003F57C95F
MTGTPPGGGVPERTAADRHSLRERTVLLGSFTARDLAGPREADAALQDFLLEDCLRITTSRGRRWCLDRDVRARTLDELGTRDRLLSAAVAAPDAGDPARAWSERLLRRAAPPLSAQGYDELYTALTVVGWFEDAPRARAGLAREGVVLPEPHAVERAMGRARLLQPLHALADATFTGRRDELARLDALLDGPGTPPGGTRDPAGGRGGRAEDAADGPSAVPGRGASRGGAHGRWLFVQGPGGVGKSTLLARFVLDRDAGSRRPAHRAPGRTPCLYLTFDRHDLVAVRPLTLAAEVVRQLGLLYPEFAREAAELAGELEVTLAADRLSGSEEGSLGGRTARRRDEQTLVDALAALVTSITGDTGARWLLALDAVEHVQRSGPVAVRRLLDFLHLLHRAHPGLRVLAAGRAPFANDAFEELPLTGFDPGTARAFLHQRLTDGADATDGDGPVLDLDEVLDIVGTSPLNLKLAAALIRRDGAGTLTEGQLRAELLSEVGAETLQGVLYRRILDHLEDPDLRRLASPGLAVRVLSPEIIRDVLAEPCGLGRVDDERARRLFAAFVAEATLVQKVPGRDAAVHRSDVRRIMLPMIRVEHRRTMDRIHRRAVRHYERLGTRDAPGRLRTEIRVEELYHRLALAQATRTLDQRWTDEAGPALESAMDELPPRAQSYLMERLGTTATALLRAEADDDTWRRQAARVGLELLAADDPDGVVRVLGERRHLVAGDLDLTLLGMRARMAQRRPADAYFMLDRARTLARQAPDPDVFVDVALLGARACEDLGRFDDALQLLAQARRITDRPGGEIRLLSVAAAQLRAHRRAGTSDGPEAIRLREDTLARVDALTLRAHRRHPLLIRELAAEIGDAMPRLVTDTARSLGVGGSEGTDDARLGSLTGEVVATPRPEPVRPGDGAPGRAVPRRAAETDPSAGPFEAVAGSGGSVSSVGRGAAIGDYVAASGDSVARWHRALIDSYRHEVDRPYTGDAVIVLPGIGGSTLVEADGDGRAVWPGVGFLRLLASTTLPQLPVGLPSTGRRAPARSALTVTRAEREGRTQRLRAQRLLPELAWLPLVGGQAPYHGLVEGIRSVVLHDDAVLEHPYDWRLSVADTARHFTEAALRHLALWKAHPARRASAVRSPADRPKLVLVAHSMGGLVVQAALAASPELAARTRDVITVGTPFHGIPGVLQLLSAPGRRRTLRNPLGPAARTMPGLYDLLPGTRCVRTPDGGLRRLTPADVAAVGGDAELAEAAEEARRRRSLATWRVHAVAGTEQATLQSMTFQDGTVQFFTHVPRLRDDGTPLRDGQGQPVLVDEGGDGVVPTRSAWPTGPAAYRPVVGHHNSLATSATVINLIREILTDRPGSGGPDAPADVASLAPSFGITAPSEVVVDRDWSLTVTGAQTSALACRLVHAETGEVVARMHPAPVMGQPGTSTAWARVHTPGFYQIVAQAGGLSASALVVAVEYPADD